MNGDALSPEELDRIKARFLKAQKRGKVRLLTPLPRKVRLRLWWAHQMSGVAVWLVRHNRFRLAEMFWRAGGMS